MYPLIIIYTLSVLACWPIDWYDIRGRYTPNNWKIYICDSVPKEEKKDVLVHELAHKFWFERMTEKERKQWTEERAKIAILPIFPHRLWNPIYEDFAYLFPYALYDKKVFRMDRKLKELTMEIINNK